MNRHSQDFLKILDGFYDQLCDSGALLFPDCHQAATCAAKDLLQSADLQYVPGHKITELMADIINIAAAVSAEGWLNDQQARKQFQEMTGQNSSLAKQFRIVTLMEKARYEPIMLATPAPTPLAERNHILKLRLNKMLAARQSFLPLPESLLGVIRHAASNAMHSDCFASYRPGPMLQFFDDMIRCADQIITHNFDETSAKASLAYALNEEGRLWKLYRHKAPRFRADIGDPLSNNAFPPVRGPMIFIPDRPGRPTLH